MAQEYETSVEDGGLKYQRADGGVQITGVSGLPGKIVIPQHIEGLAVTGIARKAFLSRKQIRSVELPGTVTQIGDWAFAYCDGLKEVIFQNRALSFGKSVFLECHALRELRICESEKERGACPQGEAGGAGAVGFLLAAAVAKMDANYLLDLAEAGSAEWMEKWDARLRAILDTPDSEGYSRQVLCGEEDYGSTDLGAYLSGKRRAKARLALLRLLYPEKLSAPNREMLRRYLLDHTKGCPGEEAWQVILKEYADDRAYYELFADLGCFHPGNAAAVISDIREEAPEMKAFFLRYRAEHFGAGDVLSGLAL